MRSLIDELRGGYRPTSEQWKKLISGGEDEYLHEAARQVCLERYGANVFVRGLIEFTNYCRCDCFYCGIRRSNALAPRYRLTKEQILECCAEGYALGFRTFVLQGGEDMYFTDERICDIARSIKSLYPDCALTLSLGERSFESYAAMRAAGADRYLLRHETACPEHYSKLHPAVQTLENRMKCLWDLKNLGFQTGAGFMVGSPHQSLDTMAMDMEFLGKLKPEMVGIGPFIPHHQTPFAAEPAGTVRMTLRMVALTRLLLPGALIPATTALATLDSRGTEKGVFAGANVVMPNLSPEEDREKYTLYDNKAHLGSESAEALALLRGRMEAIGYKIPEVRGDCVKY